MCVEIKTVCFPRKAFDQLPHRTDLIRVEADRRLVQNDQFRLVHQRVRQSDALAVAFGKLPDDAPAHVRQTALLHHRRHALARFFPAEAFQPRAEFQIFAHAHFGIQRIVFRHETDPPPHLVRLVKNIEARHARRAARRRHEARKNPHRRAFARAVRAEQADDFAARDRERNVADRRAAGVTLRQIGNFNHRASSQNLAKCSGKIHRAGNRSFHLTGKIAVRCVQNKIILILIVILVFKI